MLAAAAGIIDSCALIPGPTRQFRHTLANLLQRLGVATQELHHHANPSVTAKFYQQAMREEKA